jgi:hypothetical protein
MVTRADAIKSLKPLAEWKLKNDTVLIWYDEVQTQPTEAEIDAEVIRLQAEYDALDYARKREAEYPSVQDLVVALYDTDDKAAIEAKRAEVKAKYPKS